MKILHPPLPLRALYAICALSILLLFSSCGDPSISTVNPPSGPPGSLVQLSGDIIFAKVVWDAGTGSETDLPSGFLGANFFTVPYTAATGNHDIAVERRGDRSATMSFNVTAAVPVTDPRIDHVMMYNTSFSGGNVNSLLMVQGANIDVGAEMTINGSTVSAIPYKAMQNNLLGVAPNTLRYPIYHYVAMIVAVDEPTGSTLNIQVENLNGRTSNTFNFDLPTSAATLDSDGDNLLDSWETSGFDANGDGTIDVDLPGLGADKHRRDLFVEVDIMNSLDNPPAAAVFTSWVNAFANAPIMNIGDRPNGINLVVDNSGTVPFSSTIDLDTPTPAPAGFTSFNTLKSSNFDDANRGRIYHYGIWANARPNGSSGVSDVDFPGPGDDFIVSFDDFSAGMQTVKSGAETIMHEFGHNLAQRHGGANHFANNPTYNSVMSYNWQLRSGRSNNTRLNRPVCAPYYYGQTGAAETAAGGLFTPVGTIVDYAHGMGRNLVENNLNEGIGVCNNLAVDWNSDGDTNDNSASRDINSDGDTNDTWRDYCNWCFLNYKGPELNGTN